MAEKKKAAAKKKTDWQKARDAVEAARKPVKK